MSLALRLILITFIESFATTLVERGVYFFNQQQFGFSDAQNLWLALAFGLAYAVGALSSHRISLRLKEKRLLAAAIGAQLLVHAAMAHWPAVLTVVVGSTFLGYLNGLKWPVIESYVSAGHGTASQAKTVGRFNVSWSLATAVALAAAGPIIGWQPRGALADAMKHVIGVPASGLFLLAAGMNLLALVLMRPLKVSPAHLPEGHPDRPSAGALVRYRSLLFSSRSLMLASYSLLWVIAALIPGVFKRLNTDVQTATALSGLIDVVRMSAFIFFRHYRGWHNRAGPLLGAMVVLPGAFFAVVFGPSLAVVIVGEILFGLGAGLIYYSALYYAMVVKNASVDAGGAHEGLIGLGFAIGPAAGLVGTALAPALGGPLPGLLAGVGPLILLCCGAAIWPMVRKEGRRR